MSKGRQKIVLITGASSGIGEATAHKLHLAGYKVYVAARRIEKMVELGKSGATVLALDITSDKQITKLVKHITQESGGVDILVNNAGFGCYGTVEDISIEDARYQFEVNLFGLARLTQLILPYMRKKGGGKIINISSVVGKAAIPLASWYVASKFALEGWSDCLRLELAPFNIHVSLVEPGIIRTEFADVVMEQITEKGYGPAYLKIIQNITDRMELGKKRATGSDVSVVAKAIYKLAKARYPKIRVAVGLYAKPLIFLKKWSSDRLYDKLISFVFRINKK